MITFRSFPRKSSRIIISKIPSSGKFLYLELFLQLLCLLQFLKKPTLSQVTDRRSPNRVNKFPKGANKITICERWKTQIAIWQARQDSKNWMLQQKALDARTCKQLEDEMRDQARIHSQNWTNTYRLSNWNIFEEASHIALGFVSIKIQECSDLHTIRRWYLRTNTHTSNQQIQ